MNTTNTVTLILARNELILDNLADTKSQVKIPEGNRVVIGSSVDAELEGEPFFDVVPLQQSQQIAVENDGFVQWEWNVTAKVPGAHDLILTIKAKFPDGMYRRTKQVPIAISTPTLADEISTFIAKNWQWLWTTIAVPILAAGWALYKKRKSANLASQQ